MGEVVLILILLLCGIIFLKAYYFAIVLNKPKNNVHFYVARDKNGDLWMYLGKPIRNGTEFHTDQNKKAMCLTCNMERLGLKNKDFDNLKWEDEPVEVFLNLDDEL